ncbi:MAG: Peptidase [Devosia sp.]|nr:Peptidase [Devosia sp.]
MTIDLAAVLDHADAGLDESLARLFEFIRIPSISTDRAYTADCRRAAEWLRDQLGALGFDATVRNTTGHLMVVAHGSETAAPHVLFYGHYDVQPVDPLSLWTHPPFEPVLVEAPDGDTHIRGRGASDDKGQLLTFIEACRAWKAVTGRLPIRISMLFEGEEEAGSPSLGPFLEQTADELRADTILVCDTDMWDRATPAITTMFRGLVGEELEITAADRDLHSGMFGSAARNAAHVLAKVLASLHDDDGAVTVPGFYDGVAELPEAIAAQWQQLPFDAEKFLSDIGLSIPAGETGRSVQEMIWSRPTCEINGIWSGYTAEGFKTVIPGKASAKLSFRLVAGQDPDAVRKNFRAHVESLIPADCRVSFKPHGTSPASIMPLDSPLLRQALGALTAEWGVEAAIAGTGGSIPILGEFKRRLGMDSLLIGFARFDNRIHSPNEKYDLSSFRHGIRSWIRILAAFADGAK